MKTILCATCLCMVFTLFGCDSKITIERVEVYDLTGRSVAKIDDPDVLRRFASALKQKQAEPAKFPRAWRLVVTSAAGKEEMDANADFIRTNEGTFKLRKSVDEILNLPKVGE